MSVVRLLVALWHVAKFLAATFAAFAVAAAFSVGTAQRLRREDCPAWEAFAYSLCVYLLAGQAWWHFLLRWWLPGVRASSVFLAFAGAASFFFAIFLFDFILVDSPQRTTRAAPALRVLLALTALAGTSALVGLTLVRTPAARALRARLGLRPGRAAESAAGAAAGPKGG